MKGANEIYLPHAIGDGARHTLRICQAPGMTSLLQPNQEILKLFHGFPEWGQVLATQEVETLRLDDVVETEGAELLKIDIQGGELMALRNGRMRLRDILVIQSEVEFLPMYVDQPLFADVDGFLRQEGFMFHRFFSESSRVIRPLMVNNDIFAPFSQLIWADAIFVRDLARLDCLTDRQLLTMAAIMHDCYRSIDLALHLLSEHDRRTSSRLGAVYLAGLQRGQQQNG
jgi:FkbM family methyltransferase